MRNARDASLATEREGDTMFRKFFRRDAHFVAVLSAQTSVALMMAWMLLSKMHGADQASIKADLRKFLAEGISQMDLSGSHLTAKEEQTFRDAVSHVVQAVLAVEPGPEAGAAGLDRIFPTLMKGRRDGIRQEHHAAVGRTLDR